MTSAAYSEHKTFVSQKERLSKAKKIDAVLKDYLGLQNIEGLRILDVGCGIGQIAEYFATNNDVTCLDVEDQLQVDRKSDLHFKLIDSDKLPVNNEMFDVVITNHVIEHLEDQHRHLQEIRRVLKPMGICYLATPNKNFLVEPHYKIPLIHYLPMSWFHSLLRAMGIYKEQLFLLSYGEMKILFDDERFHITEYTARIMKDPVRFNLGSQFTGMIPKSLLSVGQFVTPTNIFVLQKSS